jgi:para-aminobenzoate synthetase component II
VILLIDNYDSFTYNLVQYFGMLGHAIRVVRNNMITLGEIQQMQPDQVVLSPGPCTPNEAGISLDLVQTFKGSIPILGICLGHQVLAQACGARIVEAAEPVHGKVHAIMHNNRGVFKGLPTPLQVTRYHSLLVDKESLPGCFEITAETVNGEIMGLQHKDYALEGVQFHPEALLTEKGLEILDNFIRQHGREHDNVL